MTWGGSGESVKYVSVYRSTDGGSFEKILATAYAQTITDRDVLSTSSYTYKVTVTDVMGFESDFSNEAGVVVSVLKGSENIISGYVLQQNYPNPFNPLTTINYQLPKNSYISIKVYNVTGEEVKTLLNYFQHAGIYSISFDATGLSSGIYFYKLRADGNLIETKKMLLLK